MFNGVQIRVGFQLEPQFMFRCTVVHVKLGFMAMFFSIAPSRMLVAKNRLYYSTHALL